MVDFRWKNKESAFKIVTWLLFGIAICTMAARISIRLWIQRKLRVDDYLLLFSSLALTAATSFLYYYTPEIFFMAELTFNPLLVFDLIKSEADILHHVRLIQRIQWAWLAVSWTVIFFVKFGFLSLFFHLVDRLPGLYKFWKGTIAFTILAYIYAVIESPLSCPKTGLDTCNVGCVSSSEGLRKILAVGIVTIILDMLTDLFVIVIPIRLLWQVQMRLDQKAGLALFLCLSICMIVQAIIRVSGWYYKGRFDIIWVFLWQQVEACIAVTMLSLAAFRSLFVARKSGSDNHEASPSMPSTRRRLHFQRKLNPFSRKDLSEIKIPSATLTGMNPFIKGYETSHFADERVEVNELP